MAATALDRSNDIPLYQQIAQQIYETVADDGYPAGASIGSEAELVERFGVSRVTVRRAVDLLIHQGIVARRHGKGTFVAGEPLEYQLDELLGTTQIASRQGRSWHSRVVDFAQTPASHEIRQRLALRPDEAAFRIRRIDYVDKHPLAVAEIFLPPHLGRRLTKAAVETAPLYPLLKEATGIVAATAHQSMRAAAASSSVARLLSVRVSAPVMVVSRLVVSTEAKPIEWSIVRFRADAIRFSVYLRASGAPSKDFAFGFTEHGPLAGTLNRLRQPST